MHDLVNSLAAQRKRHLQTVENYTINDLKEMVSSFLISSQRKKSYVPRLREKEELVSEVKYKKSWKGSGNQNDYFQVPPIMKPKILDEWTMSRVQAPERSFKKFFFCMLTSILTIDSEVETV